jgi:hypothetical protein
VRGSGYMKQVRVANNWPEACVKALPVMLKSSSWLPVPSQCL